jgi:RNA polymerase sigma-70 factor, ECF subfamily
MFGRSRAGGGDGVELALRHLDSLYGAALRLTHDGSYAEDLVQEAFLRGHRYFRRLTDINECKALLYKIMLNLWLKDHRRLQREVSLDDPAGHASWEHHAHGQRWLHGGGDPEAEVMQKTFLIAVDRALRKLPPELRVSVILADVEGFSYQEMADILQCPLGTVMSRLHRARRFLEREMKAYAEEARLGRTRA